MIFEELLEKYRAVLLENGSLKEEIENLRTKLGVSEHRAIPYGRSETWKRLLTYAMNKRHEITFKSYDRFFPNQDTIPMGGFGNLIGLPLQKAARSHNISVFIDDNFEPFKD